MKHRSGASAVLPISLLFRAAIVILAVCWAGRAFGATSGSSEIRAGSELDFRPYAYTDKDGQPTGFGVELLKAVADKMGLRIRIAPGPWEQVWDGLVAGRIDVLPVVARTPGREPLVDFSLPHTETYDAFFVREGRPEITDLAGAAGKEIVVLRSDAAHHELVERKFAGKVIPVDSIPAGLRLIAAGRHDAMLCSKLVGMLERQQAGIKGVQPGPPIPDYKRVFSFAVKKGDADLLEKLNQGLLIVKASGEYDQIYRRWLVADEPWRALVPYLKWAVAGLVVLAGLVVALQWLVRRRTRQLAAELAERRKAEAALQQLNATLERRVAERTSELRESEERLALAASGTRVGIFDRNLKTGEITATEQTVRLLGMERPAAAVAATTPSRCHMDRDWADRIHPDDLPRVAAELEKCVAECAPLESEYRVLGSDGTVRWLATRGLLQLDDRGAPARLLGILMDITERKKAEQALKASLAEKEILLKELAHRTKNNMQVISSLMSLQAATLADKDLSGVLSDTQDRIRAMALVHEKLYRSGNFSSLNIRDYAEGLLNAILGAHHVTGGRVRTETDVEDISISIDAALSLGLIINELVSNSLKHAFPDPGSGAIFLSLRRRGERTEMKYRDDGPGLPPDFDISRAQSLGLKLVHNLASLQLRGTMELRHGSQSEFVFTFGELTHASGG